MMYRHSVLPSLVWIGLLAGACVVGCSKPEAQTAVETPAPGQAAGETPQAGAETRVVGPAAPGADGLWPIMMDGDLSDWPAGAKLLADGHHIYLRLDVEQVQNLQSASVSHTVLLDLDGSKSTGHTGLPGGEGLGVDAAVQFSPAGRQGRPSGVSVAYYAGPGAAEMMTHAGLGLLASPTVASKSFEVRLDRHAGGGSERLSALLRGEGTVRARVLAQRGTGPVSVLSDLGSVVLPPLRERVVLETPPPTKPAGAIRVLSFNVLHDGPDKTPEPFAAAIKALDPDIILIQEWWGAADGAHIAGWMQRHVGPGWEAAAPGGRSGVAVISRFGVKPMLRPIVTDAPPTAGTRSSEAVRCQFAVVSTPDGDWLVGSLHLKCCGSAGSAEDTRRIAEARAIRTRAVELSREHAVRAVLIGGDVNLVGTRTPLVELKRGTDLDGSDLAAADLRVFGDRADYTWLEPSSAFGPGRLDWIVFSDSSLTAVGGFSLDALKLSDAALGTLGLTRSTAQPSDHLPLVLDVQP